MVWKPRLNLKLKLETNEELSQQFHSVSVWFVWVGYCFQLIRGSLRGQDKYKKCSQYPLQLQPLGLGRWNWLTLKDRRKSHSFDKISETGVLAKEKRPSSFGKSKIYSIVTDVMQNLKSLCIVWINYMCQQAAKLALWLSVIHKYNCILLKKTMFSDMTI